MKKYILDLAQLIFCPDSIQKVRNTSCITSPISLVTFANRMKSSAKNKWEILIFPRDALRGHHKSWEHFSSIRHHKYSIHMINRYGDKWSPCLMPLEGLKDSRAHPFTNTDKDEVEIQLMINYMMLYGNRKAWSTLCIKLHSNLL